MFGGKLVLGKCTIGPYPACRSPDFKLSQRVRGKCEFQSCKLQHTYFVYRQCIVHSSLLTRSLRVSHNAAQSAGVRK